MTLVVARNLRGTIHVLADTLVSGPSTNLRQPEHALKVFSATRDTLVCYSGSPELAHRAIKDTWDLLTASDLENAFGLLCCTEGVDFIVVHKNTISLLRNGTVQTNLPHAWIGEQAAWRFFRGESLSLDGVSPDSTSWTIEKAARDGEILRRAFEQVVTDPKLSRVGGSVVVATSGETGAAYSRYCHLVSPKFEERIGGWQSIDFGDAAKGGFGFTTITPQRPGVVGWGLYYFQPFRGFYFHADPSRNHFVQISGNATSAKDFCEFLLSEIGHATAYCGQLGKIENDNDIS